MSELITGQFTKALNARAPIEDLPSITGSGSIKVTTTRHWTFCQKGARTLRNKQHISWRDQPVSHLLLISVYPAQWAACGRSPAEIVGSNPTGAWIFVCCECLVLSGRGLCDELITRPEESYRLRCVVVCDLETSSIGAPYIYDISNLRVKFVPKYLNSSTLPKELLSIFILWLCPAFWSQDISVYLVW